MQKLPVNIPGGVPTILDGAGEIKEIVSDDNVQSLQDRIDEYQTENAVKGGQMIEYTELMRRLRTKPLVRDYKKIGRNDPCPCGAVDENGKPKKYKKCCLKTGDFETMHQLGV